MSGIEDSDNTPDTWCASVHAYVLLLADSATRNNRSLNSEILTACEGYLAQQLLLADDAPTVAMTMRARTKALADHRKQSIPDEVLERLAHDQPRLQVLVGQIQRPRCGVNVRDLERQLADQYLTAQPVTLPLIYCWYLAACCSGRGYAENLDGNLMPDCCRASLRLDLDGFV